MAAAERDCLPWLDQDELSRWRAFVFPRDRHLYLLAHGLLRWALSAASSGVHPREWRFRSGPYGQPAVAGPTADAGRTFSLSHTRGFAGVAIDTGGRVGIDIEAMRDQGDSALSAASSAFAPDERRWLEQQDTGGRAVPTLRLWTLKEAYAKARGLGIQLPFDSFSFTLAPRRGVRRFRPPPSDCGEGWRFLELGLGACRLALACERPSAPDPSPMRVHLGTTDPGRWGRGRQITVRDDQGRWEVCSGSSRRPVR